MIEKFEMLVADKKVTDTLMKVLFYRLNNSDKVKALKLLETHRPGLAKTIAREISKAAMA